MIETRPVAMTGATERLLEGTLPAGASSHGTHIAPPPGAGTGVLMKLRRLAIGLALGASLGCSTGFSRGAMETSLRANSPAYVSGGLSVEEAEKLSPQVSLPMRLVVAPPTASYRQGWGSPTLDAWSPEEVAEINGWGEALREAGVVADLTILPASLVEDCRQDDPGCRLRVQRTAAARIQADSLLVINLATAVDEYANAASALNMTIVGMWLIPGHHRDALTIAEGVLIDNRNEYVYAFARGEGEARTLRPLVYADPWKAVRPSRQAALSAFGERFVKQASLLSTR